MSVPVILGSRIAPRVSAAVASAYEGLRDNHLNRLFFGNDGDRFDGSEQRGLWEKGAEAWSNVVSAGENLYHTLFLYPAYEKFIGPVDGLKVLDAGCGEGVWSRRMARQGADVTGVDFSKTMIANARRQEKNNPQGVQYRVSDFSSLRGIPANSFDKVVTVMTMMYLPDFEKAYRALFRVLKPGGELVIITKHPVQSRQDTEIQWRFKNGKPDGVLLNGDYFRKQGFDHMATLYPVGASERVKLETVHYQHTLGDFLNPLRQVGFELQEIAEPRPEDEACGVFPELTKWKTLPFALMLKARKPE